MAIGPGAADGFYEGDQAGVCHRRERVHRGADLNPSQYETEPPQLEKEPVNRVATRRSYTKVMDGGPYSLGKIRA